MLPRRRTTVDEQVLSRIPATRTGRTQPQNRTLEFLWQSDAAKHGLSLKLSHQVRPLALQASHHVGHGVPRAQTVDADTVPRQLHRHGLHQSPDGRFRRRVARYLLCCAGYVGRDAGDKDDASSRCLLGGLIAVVGLVALDHRVGTCLCDQEGSVEVDGEGLVERFERGGQKRFVRHHPGRVDVDVDPSEVLHHLSYCRLDVFWRRDVDPVIPRDDPVLALQVV